MKKKALFLFLSVFFLALTAAAILNKVPAVYIAFSLFALCFFAMLLFGWVSVKKKNPQAPEK